MTYNKEYIEQLLQRFMDGDTTEQEEQFLAEYFSTSDYIPEEWEAYRELFASFATDAYDFTEEEQSEFLKEEAPKAHTIRLWPWLAAACVAALMVIFLAPPKEENKQVAKEEKTVAPQKEVNDTAKNVPMSHSSNEEKQLAHVAEKKTSTPQPERCSSKPRQQKCIAEPRPSNNELAKTDEPIMDEDKFMAEQLSQFKDMEMAFQSHSAPIRERGQQVIQRVSMLQQEQRNQRQFVEL